MEISLKTAMGGDDDSRLSISSLILEYVKNHGDLVFDDGERVYKISLIINENGFSPEFEDSEICKNYIDNVM